MTLQEIVEMAEQIQGWMSREELTWLAHQASTRRRIVEVGSWKGRSTKAIAMATPGFVVAVDHWLGSPNDPTYDLSLEVGPDQIYRQFCDNLRPQLLIGKVRVVEGRSAYMVDRVRGELGGDGLADMIFIDGAHDYESVRRDVELYLPMVRAGGVICGHDYGSGAMGVVRAVREFLVAPDSVHGSIWSCQR